MVSAVSLQEHRQKVHSLYSEQTVITPSLKSLPAQQTITLQMADQGVWLLCSFYHESLRT